MINKIFLLLFLCSFFVGNVKSNNVRFESSARILDVDDNGIATIEVGLKWDNAWRNFNNWDGVWLFFKYRKDKTSDYEHVNLELKGHEIVDTSGSNKKFTYHTGLNHNKATGLFVVLSENANINPRLVCRLKWRLPDDVAKEDFANATADLFAHALEMVYVRTGSYSLGQSSPDETFDSIYINSENSLIVKAVGAVGSSPTKKTLDADYPKGFQGFYAMKYELSQEQLVRFLNSLKREQQNDLITFNDKFPQGGYIWGRPPIKADKRNGIVLAVKSTDTKKPHAFACNLIRDTIGILNDVNDGQNIPCSFMNISFLTAYCSWSGLRPMSELEFEKSCRRPYPFVTVPNEYVWGSTTPPELGTKIDFVNTPQEIPISGNVNAGNREGFDYPIRIGSFAAAAAAAATDTTALARQFNAGATYWGLMEMGGNLKEIVVSANYGNFSRDIHGLGTFSKTLWSKTGTDYGYRGGSFLSAIKLLRTTDRSEMGGIKDYNEDANSIGFRAVRSFSSNSMGTIITAGSIAPHNICPARDIHIIEESPASFIGVGDEQAIFTYEWTINNALINDFSGPVYVIKSAEAGKKYDVIRRAICQYGVEDTRCTFTVPKLTLDNINLNLDTCIVGHPDTNLSVIKINLKGTDTEMVYDWYVDKRWVHSGHSYAPTHNTFADKIGFSDLIYRATLVNCPIPLLDTIKVYNACSDSVLYDTRNNKLYRTVVGSNGGHILKPYLCWMAENLNFGQRKTIANTGIWQFDDPGVQKWCYDNTEANCVKYGGLYEWWETVCGGDCNDKLTSENAQTIDISSERELKGYGAKMVPNNNNLVQGICPNGWHLPTNEEWTALAKVQGDFNFKLGGYRYVSGYGFYNLGAHGYWWSSTPTGVGSRHRDLRSTVVGAAISASTSSRSGGFSVRCVRN